MSCWKALILTLTTVVETRDKGSSEMEIVQISCVERKSRYGAWSMKLSVLPKRVRPGWSSGRGRLGLLPAAAL